MKNYLLNHNTKYSYFIFIVDAFLIVLGILFSYSIRIYLNQGEYSFLLLQDKLNLWHIFIIPLHLFTLYVLDLYNPNRLVNTFRMSVFVVISVLSAGLIIGGVFFFLPRYVFGRQVMLIHLFVLSIILVCWRLFFLKIYSEVATKKKIALICHPYTASMFIDQMSLNNFNGLEVSRIFCKQGYDEFNLKKGKLCSSLNEVVLNNEFDILGFDSSMGDFSNDEIRLILETKQKNKGVYEIASLFTSLTGRVPLEMVDGKWLMNSQGLQGMVSRPYIQMKRLFDICAGSFLLILFSPLIVLISIIIKLESKGGIIFSQERLGKNRKPFMCYKFRTMINDAEQHTGEVWSSYDDPRVTTFGRFLRKTRLDELPQLWNIIIGDISFVGPRPIRKYFADQLSTESPFYELRFSVQPGLSGWAQIHGCYAVPYGLEALKYELFYIQNMSLFLDIIVVFKTIQSFFKAEGK